MSLQKKQNKCRYNLATGRRSDPDLLRQRQPCQMPRRPGVLKVKTTRYPVHIEHFACKVEARNDAALERP